MARPVPVVQIATSRTDRATCGACGARFEVSDGDWIQIRDGAKACAHIPNRVRVKQDPAP
jgi:hypothetical protein